MQYIQFLNRFMFAQCIIMTMTFIFLSFYYFAFGFNLLFLKHLQKEQNYYAVWQISI